MSSMLDADAVGRALGKVVSDAIRQVETDLVPAIANAAKDAASGLTVTVGPITIEPIKISIGSKAD